MRVAILLYLSLGLLMAEGSYKQSKLNPEKYHRFNWLSYAFILFLWPLMFMLIILRRK